LTNKEKKRERSKNWREANKDKAKEQHKAWYEANKDKAKEQHKAWYEANPEYQKAYRESNKDKIKEYQKAYCEANKEKRRERSKNWREANKDKVKAGREANKERRRELTKKRRKEDAHFRLGKLLRTRIIMAVKSQNTQKCKKSIELLGCSIEFLKEILQQTAIQNGYLDFDINNYSGREYHIDHIIPCALFDLTKEEEQKACFHWSNLQILTAEENLAKGTGE